jgi:hypothetical protein
VPSFGFERPFFLTFNLVQELGATVRRGSKVFHVVFWEMLESREGPTKKVPYLRYYQFFSFFMMTMWKESLKEKFHHTTNTTRISTPSKPATGWCNKGQMDIAFLFLKKGKIFVKRR